jgi:hypothetical protein
MTLAQHLGKLAVICFKGIKLITEHLLIHGAGPIISCLPRLNVH